MNLPAWMVRTLTYPAYERLRGRPTLQELAALSRLAAAAPAELNEQLAIRLRALLRFAARHLPYYADLFARCRIDPNGADPWAELGKLPPLDKAAVRENAQRMVWAEVPGGPQPHSSGGTSGDTLHFFVDRVRQAQDLAARLFMQSQFGVRPGDRRLHLWGCPIETRGGRLKRWRDALINERLLDAFDLSPTRLDAYLKRILDFKPQVVYGYPTAVALLAQHAAASRRPSDFPWLRVVVLTGEEASPAQMDRVRQTFGCPVAIEYGSREVGLIAHQCPAGGLHVIAPHIHLEVAVSGRPVEAGSCGEVLCTTLNARAQPFLRYRVGDLARRLAESCSCGLPFPLMRLKGGKITGFIALPDGRLCHGAVTSHFLRDEPGILAYKTYQRSLYEFEVLLVVDRQFDPATLTRLQQRYRRLCGPRVRVDCRLVDRIPPEASGKRCYVVSQVAREYAGGALAN